MRYTRVAHRYAEAILDATPEGSEVETMLADLRDVQASIEGSRELKLFFESPVISQKKKAEAVQALFSGRVSDYVLSVLLLLVEKGRETLVLLILSAVMDVHRRRQGIVRTHVRSAVTLGEEQRARLVQALGAASGKRVEAQYSVDPSLMGGLLVRLDDTVYDGSVLRQLDRLRTRFISGR
ncbi:MAG: ATP synthase F1 subunit delta [Bacteroidota bacterium]|nr:ATP synthase F1 subunit delta [Bacteroidota bacterium]